MASPERHEPDQDLPPPTGTVLILTVYIAVLAGMWGVMYLTLLGR